MMHSDLSLSKKKVCAIHVWNTSGRQGTTKRIRDGLQTLRHSTGEQHDVVAAREREKTYRGSGKGRSGLCAAPMARRTGLSRTCSTANRNGNSSEAQNDGCGERAAVATSSPERRCGRPSICTGGGRRQHSGWVRLATVVHQLPHGPASRDDADRCAGAGVNVTRRHRKAGHA